MRLAVLLAVLGCSEAAPPPEQVLADVAAPAVEAPPPEPEPEPAAEPEPVVEPPPIVEWPIPFDDERKQLTVAYLKEHRGEEYLSGDLETDITFTPRVVVLHWTGGPTAKSAWHSFAPVRNPRPLPPERAVNLSAQFLVDRDGTIYRLFPENWVGRHTIGLNHISIGVENVGGIGKYKLTAAQVDANVALIRWLAAVYPITHVIGHYEYREMEGHPYFLERDPEFRTIKADPGEQFMTDVRARITDLGLSGPP